MMWKCRVSELGVKAEPDNELRHPSVPILSYSSFSRHLSSCATYNTLIARTPWNKLGLSALLQGIMIEQQDKVAEEDCEVNLHCALAKQIFTAKNTVLMCGCTYLLN